MLRTNDDTIVAIATPVGIGGIGVIRLSGENALNLVRQCISGIKNVTPRYVHFGDIIDPDSKQPIDQACIIYFKGPQSYTGEDVVELQTHSSPYVLQKLLQICLTLGAGLATKGEFTKRAFIHGKLDLTQAESVIDLIHSESEKAHRVSLAHVDGVLYRFISTIRSVIKPFIETIEGSIDFPDEVPSVDRDHMTLSIRALLTQLEKTLSYQDLGEVIKEGVRCLIVGKPNVGKSSLFNALLNKDRAIVTSIPGTTRDYLDSTFNYRGLQFHIQDTAGVRDSSDEVESMGIQKMKTLVQKAHLICVVLDQSSFLEKEDQDVYETIQSHPKPFLILNKSDLPAKLTLDDLSAWDYKEKLEVCATEKVGLDLLKETLYNAVITDVEEKDLELLCNSRQKSCLEKLNVSLQHILSTLDQAIENDLLVIELRQALVLCGEFSGEEITEEVLDGIFSRFCVGK